MDDDNTPYSRLIIIKATPDEDLYVGWSRVVEAPGGLWTRAQAEADGIPTDRLDRADLNGSSSIPEPDGPGEGNWSDAGFIAEQRGWLRRDRIGAYTKAYAAGDMNAAFDLLEPFDDEHEVNRDLYETKIDQ